MKIALYLGSFNPFHNGHLKVVNTALDDFKMDRVVIVPAMQNPWKKDKVLRMYDRIKIIKEYIRQPIILDKPSTISIDPIEQTLISPYYSYATLHALKTKYCNDEIFVLCGEDTMKDIPNWMHGGKIIEDYNFLIVDRPEKSISSTQIREYIKQGKDISKFVSKNVINLIKQYYET